MEEHFAPPPGLPPISEAAAASCEGVEEPHFAVSGSGEHEVDVSSFPLDPAVYITSDIEDSDVEDDYDVTCYADDGEPLVSKDGEI